MARNGPAGQPGARAPVRRHPADDQFTSPPTGQPPAHWPPAGHYADQHYADQQQAPSAPQWPPAPHFELAPAHPASHQPHQPAGHQPASHWAPQPPQYAETPRTQPPQHGQPARGQPQQQGQDYYFPQGAEPEPNYGFAPPPQQQAAPRQPPDYGAFHPAPAFQQAPHHQPQQAPHHQPAPPPHQAQPAHQQAMSHAPQGQPPWSPQQADPRTYDLGNYMPASAPQQGYPQAEPAHYQGAHDPVHFGAPQQGYAETEAEYDEGMLEEDEEPRRGRRGLMIAAALVGAIGLGGGMAYTYKSLFASSGTRAPLIKNVDAGPNKIRPESPGGKQFAHTDKKLLNRLPDDRPGASDADQSDERVSDDPNAPRKVKIIPITPSGMQPAPVVTSSVPPPPPAQRPPAPMVSVPGVMLENMTPPSAARAQLPPPSPPAARAPSPPPVARAPSPPPVAPVRIASAAPTPVPTATEPAPPAPRKLTQKEPVPKVKEARAPIAPTVSTSGTSGYVAVLSSKKSRMDALKAFADLQQKYGDVLATRTPDVQEANLGDKGVWYRAVVGPPGSRDAAAGVCSQLKTAGYAGCWVTAY